MHHRHLRFLARTVAAVALGAATAPVSLAPALAAEGSGSTVVVDCADSGLPDTLAAARDAAAAAKKAFTELRGPDAREVKEQRAEARRTAKQAARKLEHAHGPEDRAAAKAARAELRAAQKTLRASYKEAVKALHADRRAAKAAWDQAKKALHDLQAAAEGCETADEPTEGPTDDPTDGPTEDPTEGSGDLA